VQKQIDAVQKQIDYAARVEWDAKTIGNLHRILEAQAARRTGWARRFSRAATLAPMVWPIVWVCSMRW
jgi:hypothetical protein